MKRIHIWLSSFLALQMVSVSTTNAQELAHTFNTKVEYSYQVKTLNAINTKLSEFSPVILGDKIVFSSDREFDLVSWGESHWKKKKHLNIYAASFKSPANDSVVIKNIHPFYDDLFSGYHNGPIAFHPNGELAVVTMVADRSGEKIKRPQLFIMSKKGNGWTEPEALPFVEPAHSFGHACFSKDGKTLYFASDMNGSMGGKDIFYVSYENGAWGTPVNAGKEVNSSANELYPHAANGNLYFSSDGRGSLGGLDLYVSKIKERQQFSEAENMGSSINTPADEFSIYFTADGKNGFFASNRKGVGGDDIYFFKLIETVTMVSKNITGRVRMSKLNDDPSGLKVQLVDESGNIVATVETDKDGRFHFDKLPLDQSYSLKVVSDNPDLVLEILSENGEPVAVLMTDKRGSFAFKKLPNDEVGSLKLMTVEDSDLGVKEGTLSGQVIHEKLREMDTKGIHMQLVDESGQIFAEVTTDKYGNFVFDKLPTDKNLILKTLDNSDDLLVLIYNDKDEVVAELKKDGTGVFIFRKLSEDLAGSLRMMEAEDSDLFPKNYTILGGSFVFDLLSTDPRSLSFKVYDEGGNLLQSGKTDKKGNFILSELPAMDKYLFKLDEKDAALNESLKLQMLSRYGDETHFITVDGQSYFVYDRNAKGTTVHESTADKMPEIPLIYFAKNSSALDANSKKVLDEAYDILKKNPAYKLEVHAHADARASDAFNDVLTEKRMVSARNYLLSKGIDKKRVKGFYHGKKMLLVKCPDDKCTEDQHRQNRRTEFKFVKN